MMVIDVSLGYSGLKHAHAKNILLVRIKTPLVSLSSNIVVKLYPLPKH